MLTDWFSCAGWILLIVVIRLWRLERLQRGNDKCRARELLAALKGLQAGEKCHCSACVKLRISTFEEECRESAICARDYYDKVNNANRE